MPNAFAFDDLDLREEPGKKPQAQDGPTFQTQGCTGTTRCSQLCCTDTCTATC